MSEVITGYTTSGDPVVKGNQYDLSETNASATVGRVSFSPLREALEIVYGNRMKRYGHPADVYARVGRIWGAVLGVPDIPADKVILMLQGLKLGREAENPDDDNPRDGAGYWEAYALTLARGR